MKNQGMIYYAFCSGKSETPGKYLEYQRRIADQILDYGFRKKFGIQFEREKLKKGEHGKPCWQGEEKVCFNVSNTEGLVACALSECEVGVDAEKIRRIRMPVVRRSCSLQELSYIFEKEAEWNLQEHIQNRGTENLENSLDFWKSKRELEEREQERFFQIWTLKESYLKMTGEGLHFPIRDVEFKRKEIESGLNISCNYTAFFQQKKIKEYWLTVCTQEEREILWEEVRLEDLRGK
ncbi:MAG: 4'-phosphopantetheinyl transferase superfamily protein [Lachnospiraceae bacterium]|nr:4'-phosphopantetheinyl transferase superfamily protein [Lachnospiraceae bacterium]